MILFNYLLYISKGICRACHTIIYCIWFSSARGKHLYTRVDAVKNVDNIVDAVLIVVLVIEIVKEINYNARNSLQQMLLAVKLLSKNI